MARILKRRVAKPTRTAGKSRVSPQEINQWLQLGLSTAKIAEALVPDDPTVSRGAMEALIRARMAGADAPPSAAAQYVQSQISGQPASTPGGGGSSQPSSPPPQPAAPVQVLDAIGNPVSPEVVRARHYITPGKYGEPAASKMGLDLDYEAPTALDAKIEERADQIAREALADAAFNASLADTGAAQTAAAYAEGATLTPEQEMVQAEGETIEGLKTPLELLIEADPEAAQPASEESQARAAQVMHKVAVVAPRAVSSVNQALALYDNLVEATKPRGFFERLGYGMADRMNAVNKAFMANLNMSPLARKGSGAELSAAVRLIAQKRREVEAEKARTGRADLQEAAIEGRRVGRERTHVLRGEYAAARDVSKKAGKDYTQKLKKEIEGLKYGNRKRLANHKNSLTRGDMGIRAWWKLLGRPDKPTGNDKLILDGRKYLQKKLTGAITTQTAKLEAIVATDVYAAAALVEAEERTVEQNKAIEQARMQLIFVDAARKEYTDQRATILRLAGEAGYQNPPTIPELPKYELPPGLGESTSSEWLEMDDD